MIITLPPDVISLYRCRRGNSGNSFVFRKDINRVIVPQDVRNIFPFLGVDLFVSPSEKCLYLTFGNPDKTQFHINGRTGYISSKQLFEWFINADVHIFEDYRYTQYDIDRKNKIVKLKLVRK